jgi:hypothetical protein
MEKNYDIFDLYYYPRAGYHNWHYELSFESKYIHDHWICISKNQHDRKLNLFTEYYIPLILGSDISVKKIVPDAEQMKNLWFDFELFLTRIKKHQLDILN